MVVAPEDYPGKKYRGRYCYEHHLVYWLKFGVIPQKGQVVHHINHNKTDNSLTNLELKSVALHNTHHHLLTEPNTSCELCKKPLRVRPSRLKRNTPVFCSRQHSGKYYSDKYWNVAQPVVATPC